MKMQWGLTRTFPTSLAIVGVPMRPECCNA
jgi:hypothetical protein